MNILNIAVDFVSAMQIDIATLPNELIKRRLLVSLAEMFTEFTWEVGGNNRGPVIEWFQRAIGKAVGEPWCMSSMQRLVNKTDEIFDKIHMASHERSKLFPSEHCVSVWTQSPMSTHRQRPEEGFIAIWQRQIGGKLSSAGHCGVVVDVIDDDHIWTVEGNTSPTGSGSQREGDGFYTKKRPISGPPGFVLKGFLNPWG